MNESIPAGSNRNGATEAVDQDGNPMLFNDAVPIPADEPLPEESRTSPAAEWEAVDAWEDLGGQKTELTAGQARRLYGLGFKGPDVMDVLRAGKDIKTNHRNQEPGSSRNRFLEVMEQTYREHTGRDIWDK